MAPAFKSYRLTKSGSLNIKHQELASLLGLSSPADSVIAFEIPGEKAVLLMRLDPLKPIPEGVRRIVEPDQEDLPALVEERVDEAEGEAEGEEAVL